LNNLINKRILITAGPTWVPIDNVRVISNIATGQTGILLAKEAYRQGAKVTLLLGPISDCCLDNSINIIRFKFFDELYKVVKKELKNKKYDIVIHSAAVSDYKPEICYRQKIKSDIKKWRLNLISTPKIIDLIKKFDSTLFLVGFKFEPGLSKHLLLKKARSLMHRAKLDLTVANSFHNGRYMAYILSKNKTYGVFKNKTCLTKELIKIIGDSL
jgi:phosphopantothenoylcysteine decarboxylase/phosphopantothenate--cysteine ligase